MNFLLKNNFFLIFLMLVNFAAGIYSLAFYYWGQVAGSNPLIWFLIADCPFYAIIFALNIFFIAKGKPSALLSFISIIGNIKYGAWTIFVLALGGNFGAYWLFYLSHSLFILEVIVLAGIFAFKVKHVLFATVWFVFNDYLDYVVGLHPYVPQEFLAQAGLFSIAASLVLPFVVSILFSTREEKLLERRKIKEPKIEKGKKWAHRGK